MYYHAWFNDLSCIIYNHAVYVSTSHNFTIFGPLNWWCSHFPSVKAPERSASSGHPHLGCTGRALLLLEEEIPSPSDPAFSTVSERFQHQHPRLRPDIFSNIFYLVLEIIWYYLKQLSKTSLIIDLRKGTMTTPVLQGRCRSWGLGLTPEAERQLSHIPERNLQLEWNNDQKKDFYMEKTLSCKESPWSNNREKKNCTCYRRRGILCSNPWLGCPACSLSISMAKNPDVGGPCGCVAKTYRSIWILNWKNSNAVVDFRLNCWSLVA